MSENWADITGWPPYQASTLGRIRNGQTLKILTPYKNTGYHTLKLCREGVQKSWRVHRLIALTFIPNPDDKLTVNHKNHDSEDNRADNLEWATVTEQNRHKRRSCPSALQGSRRVWQCHRETGERLQLYPSVRAAALEVRGANSAAGSICAVAGKKIHNGHVQPTAFGYKWEYDMDDEQLDGECWREVPAGLVRGVEGYFVSDQGRIRNHSGKVGRAYGKAGRYPYFSIRAFQVRAHILVAKVFVPNTEQKPFVNHINGDKADCRAANLEWMTAAENSQHAVDTGLCKTSRAVFSVDTDGDRISYPSTNAASRATNIPQPSIWAAAFGRLLHAGGLQWQFVK